MSKVIDILYSSLPTCGHKAVDYNETCLDGYLRCPNESICALQCDGVAECEAEAGFDESDELGCQAGDGTIILEATEQPASISSPNHPATYQNNLGVRSIARRCN